MSRYVQVYEHPSEDLPVAERCVQYPLHHYHFNRHTFHFYFALLHAGSLELHCSSL